MPTEDNNVNMDKQSISEICLTCKFSRKCWSTELHVAGYSGCVAFDDDVRSLIGKVESEIIGTGWIDNSYPDTEKSSGVLFNNVPIVRTVSKCSVKRIR